MLSNKSFLGAFLTGIGEIGMLDGVVFHQILQWHSVFMGTDVPAKSAATDGFIFL